MLIIVAIVLIGIAWIATHMYEVVLLVVGAIAIFVFINKFEKIKANSVRKALLESEVAVYKTVSEHTGYSVGWRWGSRRDHYRYKKVIDHYECTFSVIYTDGKRGTIRCRKGDAVYKRLIQKVDKP